MSSSKPTSPERRETLARLVLGGGALAVGGLGYLAYRLVRSARGEFRGDVHTGLPPKA